MDNQGLERREDPGKLAQHVGAQEYADHQVGQHGIDADSQEQGHHQPGNPQDDEELLVMRDGSGFHRGTPVRHHVG